MWRKMLFSLFLISGMSVSQGVTTVKAETNKMVVRSDEANVTLYATESEGYFEKFEMKIDGGTRYFPFWRNVSNPSYAPTILYRDINQDGKKELIIVLIRGYGTGVLDSEVHAFHKIQTNRA